MDNQIQDVVRMNIRAMRAELNWSQENLAEKLDISQNALSKIELGYTNITINRLAKIADLFGVPITEMLFSSNKAS